MNNMSSGIKLMSVRSRTPKLVKMQPENAYSPISNAFNAIVETNGTSKRE